MKNRKWLAGMLALLCGLTALGCDTPTGGGGGGGGSSTTTPTSTAKETITVSETMAGVDPSINISGSTNGITYSLKSSKLSINFPKSPTGATSISSGFGAASSVSAAPAEYSITSANARAVQYTPANSQARFLQTGLFHLGDKILCRFKTTTNGNTRTDRMIAYIYVSADVTISAPEVTQNLDASGGITVTDSAYTYALKKGWQLVEFKKVWTLNQQPKPVLITRQIVAESDIPWVLVTENDLN
jgi:hypothetical protein